MFAVDRMECWTDCYQRNDGHRFSMSSIVPKSRISEDSLGFSIDAVEQRRPTRSASRLTGIHRDYVIHATAHVGQGERKVSSSHRWRFKCSLALCSTLNLELQCQVSPHQSAEHFHRQSWPSRKILMENLCTSSILSELNWMSIVTAFPPNYLRQRLDVLRSGTATAA